MRGRLIYVFLLSGAVSLKNKVRNNSLKQRLETDRRVGESVGRGIWVIFGRSWRTLRFFGSG
jgi:hypothetical protein